jgi:hypothetical protein
MPDCFPPGFLRLDAGIQFPHRQRKTKQKGNTMNRTSLALAAALSVAAFAAHADDGDLSGQFAASANTQATRAQVQAQLVDYKKAGVNPWSIQYNPLNSFRGQKTREQVRNEFLANRKAVSALTAEDSGSAYLAANKQAFDAAHQFAGQPVQNAQ